MALPFAIDFKNPDYVSVYKWRAMKLAQIRANPSVIPALKSYYRDHLIDFIEDWGMTFDPRNVNTKIPAAMPFILFPRQREWLQWVLDRWQSKEPGVTEKSRDVGISWLAVGLSSTICLFHSDVVIGFGSRKEEYVDKKGSPKALFHKARQFVGMLPEEFRGGWDADTHAPHMRIIFPETNSAMTGEAGDNIGRGDRTSIYFVDESAHLERPHLVDASLSATTNCRIDMSSVCGLQNSFAEKRHGGKIDVFIFDWREDPRKDDAWYAKMETELDPITRAQEIDRNYSASVAGVIIPSDWVQASIDAHVKLGIKPTGIKKGALDVADEGPDFNAFCGRHGILVEYLEKWSGKGDDIFKTVEKAFFICDTNGYRQFDYDADGLGSGARGDARVINERRKEKSAVEIAVDGFRGSGVIVDPDGEMVKGRKNEDFFENAKAQAWWSLRMRFQATYRAVVEKMEYKPDDIISISGSLAERMRLTSELSQPTYGLNKAGKVVVNKSPEGTKSPNLADSVMIAFAPRDMSGIDFMNVMSG